MKKKIKKPKKLFKYQPFSNWSLVNLKNRCLWFSKPKRFNDPYDCRIRLSFDNVPEYEWETILEAYLIDMKERFGDDFSEEENKKEYITNGKPNEKFKKMATNFVERIFMNREQTMMNERGVACFSDKFDDMLMWSHYAEGHKGFCIEFDTRFEPFKDDKRLFKVNYSEVVPIVSLADIFVSDDEKAIKPLMSLITTKSDKWSYESEWRVFHMQGDHKFFINHKAFSGVFFGCEMPNDHKEIIALILKDSPTKLFETSRMESKFGIEFEKVIYNPVDYGEG